MKNKIFKKDNIALISLISLVLFRIVCLDLPSLRGEYITSEYSKYCYKNVEENKNIKHKIHYKTLKECNKPLKS